VTNNVDFPPRRNTMRESPDKLAADADLQNQSRLWWNQNPMDYDWRKTMSYPEGSRQFFDEIDRRLFASSPFYGGKSPFERLIPFDDLRGKRVLEIGCGMGSHAQLLADAEADLSAIDLTPRAVETTRKRLTVNGLQADLKVMDAERLEFGDAEFDFVWSWGVIHHSADTGRILDEVHRVLRPGGEFRFMVYHRRSISAWTSIMRGILSGKVLRGASLADVMSHYTDGYLARFYTRNELAAVLREHGFSGISIKVMGQTSDLIPIPGGGLSGRFKTFLVAKLPKKLSERLLSLVGSYAFAIARKPAAASLLHQRLEASDSRLAAAK
jgi:2-polyprenyl-3-methyl-5-hydroxy-6-metoxy-1,4-benzoquinol methylase